MTNGKLKVAATIFVFVFPLFIPVTGRGGTGFGIVCEASDFHLHGRTSIDN